MATISKFLFDHEFDAGADPADGPPPPRPDLRRFSALELEAAKAAAHAEGAAAGREAAEKETGRRVADTLAAIGRLLAQLMADSAQAHARATRDAVAMAGEIARKLMPALAQREALAEIEALVGDCLARLHDEPRLVIRVSDGSLDALKQRLEPLAAAAGFSGRLILIAEGALGEADARVEWADGGVDRDVAAAWRDIDNAIQRYVKDGSGAPGAA